LLDEATNGQGMGLGHQTTPVVAPELWPANGKGPVKAMPDNLVSSRAQRSMGPCGSALHGSLRAGTDQPDRWRFNPAMADRGDDTRCDQGRHDDCGRRTPDAEAAKPARRNSCAMTEIAGMWRQQTLQDTRPARRPSRRSSPWMTGARASASTATIRRPSPAARTIVFPDPVRPPSLASAQSPTA